MPSGGTSFWGDHAYLLLWALGGLSTLLGMVSIALWRLLRFIWSGQQTQVSHCLDRIKKEIDEMMTDAKNCREMAARCRSNLVERFASKPDVGEDIKRLFERQDLLREMLPKDYINRPDFEWFLKDLKEQFRDLKGNIEMMQKGIEEIRKKSKNN